MQESLSQVGARFGCLPLSMSHLYHGLAPMLGSSSMTFLQRMLMPSGIGWPGFVRVSAVSFWCTIRRSRVVPRRVAAR